MKAKSATGWVSIALMLAGGYLLGSGACISKSAATGFVDGAATRIANLVLDAILIDPLQDTLDQSTGRP